MRGLHERDRPTRPQRGWNLQVLALCRLANTPILAVHGGQALQAQCHRRKGVSNGGGLWLEVGKSNLWPWSAPSQLGSMPRRRRRRQHAGGRTKPVGRHRRPILHGQELTRACTDVGCCQQQASFSVSRALGFWAWEAPRGPPRYQRPVQAGAVAAPSRSSTAEHGLP